MRVCNFLGVPVYAAQVVVCSADLRATATKCELCPLELSLCHFFGV